MHLLRGFVVFILFCLVVFFANIASAGPFSWIKGSGKSEVKTFKRDLAEPLIVDTGAYILIVKGYDTLAIIDKLSSMATVYFSPKTEKNKKIFKFTSEEQAEKWLQSSYPGYKCWTDNGIEKCKK